MTQEFTALCNTSLLPDWLAEGELSRYRVLEMAGTHGDEQDQVAYIQSRMSQAARVPGVVPIIANRLAAEEGRRVAGDGILQLMACYPGSFQAESNESRAAAGILWLARQLARRHIVIDRHDNSRGNRYASIGEATTASVLGAAHLLGHTVCQIFRRSAFRTAVPRLLIIEEAMPAAPLARQAYYHQHDGYRRQIAALGDSGLAAICHREQLWRTMQFHELIQEVELIDPRTGMPNEHIRAILPELEDAGAGAVWGTPLRVSQRARQVLGLRPDGRYRLTAASYQNRSLPIDNELLGLADGVPRRAAWGAIIAECSGPRFIPGTNYLTFQRH